MRVLQRRIAIVLAVLSAAVTTASPALAIRPFITDDARVVGAGHAQLESWWRRDRRSMQQWAIAAFGPNDHIELSMGGVHGASRGPQGGAYAISGPLAQAKLLLVHTKDNGHPGLAVALGGEPPWGRGGFEVPGWSAFGYLAVTQSLFDEERLLIHANVGFLSVEAPGYKPLVSTWGVGTQARLLLGLHAVGEIFSGDPYVPGSGGAAQGGFRYVFSDTVQLDATMGSGFDASRLPIWFSSGVRLVTPKLW